jgi:hypothetical protein
LAFRFQERSLRDPFRNESREFQQEALAYGAFPPDPEAARDFKGFVDKELKRWAEVVRISGATAD